jgi:hypothetical protein
VLTIAPPPVLRMHILNSYLILLFVLLIRAGIAFNAPAFSSLLTDVVSEKELASASVLTGLQFDHSAIIGSALAGAAIPLIGTDIVFAVNSAAFLLVSLALLWWGRSREQAYSVMENFLQSFATAVRFVRYAPWMQVVLTRQILFSVLAATVPALLPVGTRPAARRDSTGNPNLYSRKQTLPRQALAWQSPNARSMRAGSD